MTTPSPTEGAAGKGVGDAVEDGMELELSLWLLRTPEQGGGLNYCLLSLECQGYYLGSPRSKPEGPFCRIFSGDIFEGAESPIPL